ncbi:MAG: hypothetical protein WB561_08335, partial [Terracidiphilus sp.]
GNALGQEREFGGLLAALQLILGQAGKSFSQGAVVVAHVSIGLPHLVKSVIERVVTVECFHFR